MRLTQYVRQLIRPTPILKNGKPLYANPAAPTILEQVRELLDERRRWTQGALARDSYGFPVSPYSKHAVQWCVTGAIRKIITRHPTLSYREGLTKPTCQLRQVYGRSPESVNDILGHGAVLKLLDYAIERSEHGHDGDSD